MAELHNELKQVTELQRAYRLSVGLEDGGLERAGETLTPIADPYRDELAFHRGEKLCSGWGSRAAGGVNTFATIWLLNPVALPPESGLLVTVDRVDFSAAANSDLTFRIQAGTLGGAAAVTTLGIRDGRWLRQVAQIPWAQLYTAVPAAAALAGFQLARKLCLANTTIRDVIMPVILPPGYSLMINTTTANVALDPVNIHWRERYLLRGELA
jgi:hypothetical protein